MPFPDALHKELPFLLLELDVFAGGLYRLFKERHRQICNGIAFGRDASHQPAIHQHVVVIDDMAAGDLDGLDEVQGGLLAERTRNDDAGFVAHRAILLLRRSEIVPHQLRVLLDGQDHACPHQQIDLGGRRFPWLFSAE